jgi:DNA-binding transcriptional LysR family regulator
MTETAPVSPAPASALLLEDWNLLRSLVAVVETGSLNQAAQRLGMTQPSISRHMRELERLVGETLFDRRPGGLAPTARAQALYQSVRGMQDQVRQAESLFADAPDRVGGLVRVTTSEDFGANVLPAWLGELMHTEPALHIELRAINTVENLVRRDADIAVRFVRPDQPGLIARRVGTVNVGLYATHDYLQRHGEPTTLEASAKHLLIGNDSDTVTLDDAGTAVPAYVKFRFRSDSSQTRLAAVMSGMGIGYMPSSTAQTRPQLRRVMADLVNIPMAIWLCGHDDLRRSARIRRVYDFLDERLSAAFGGDQ